MIVLLGVPAMRAHAGPAPLDAYAVLPTGASPKLSPDGNALAMIGSSGGKPAFVIIRFDGTPPKVFSVDGWLPYRIDWKSPTLLVAGLRTSWGDNYGSDSVRVNTRLLILAADGSRATPVDLMIAGGRFH